MSPLTPTGSWSRHTSDASTETVPLTEDEWAHEHLATLRGQHLTHDEVAEGERLLVEVKDLVGHVPAEITAFLSALLHERDGASMRLLRFLRGLDLEAKS